MQAQNNQQRIFYYLLAGVCFLHASFMVVKFRTDFAKVPDFSETQPAPIKVSFMPETMPVPGKTAPAIQKKQIVQSEESASSEKKDSAFLSDKTRSFDREALAKNIDTFNKTGKGNSTKSQIAEKSAAEPSKKASMKDIKLSDIGINTGDMPELQKRAPASASEKGLENGDPNEKGFSATNDYVQEVALGDFTHLNTVEFKFYGFYHRIRQKLEQFWGKSIQEKSHALFKSGRRMPASQDLITSLQVTLNEKGEIVKVKILGASGVKELDDAAVESFNEAGPFPNPPKDLLVNGYATIEWGFVVKS
jgi:TonB family protein